MPPSLLHLVTLREVREREFLGTRGAPRHCASTVQSDKSGSRAVFLQRSITVVILTSKLDHFFTRASWAAAATSILDNQLLAFTAERFDRRCDVEKLRVLSSLKVSSFSSANHLPVDAIQESFVFSLFFLITCRIECETTFAQAFQRSDQIAWCALHWTLRVAG